MYVCNMGCRCTASELTTNNYQSEVTTLNFAEQSLKFCHQYREKLVIRDVNSSSLKWDLVKSMVTQLTNIFPTVLELGSFTKATTRHFPPARLI